MSQSDKPAWPSSGAFPFMPFPVPGWPSSAAPAPPPSPPAAGFDLLKSLWSQMPGSTQVPGFLVPTVDVDEIDKRIADLRAAESWIEVNMNMLRATIQGLEVQRHTIAALQSLSRMPDTGTTATKPAREATPPAPRAEAPTPPPAPPAEAKPDEPQQPTPDAEAAPAAPLAGMGASNWLGYLQDQFTKVAQAALSASTPAGSRTAAQATAPPPKRAAAKRPAAKRKPAAKRRKAPATPP